MAWVQSGEYDRIVGGEYPTRDQQADARKEAGEAVEFYKERFRRIFNEFGGDKADDSVADAADEGRRLAARRNRPAAATRSRRAVAAPPHAHGHAPRPRSQPRAVGRRRPALARRSRSALILAFMVVEVVAGLLADSLALLSDAAHMLTDAGSIALALVAARLAARPPGGRFTFGLGRAEILSAQVNGAALLVLAGVIAWEAVAAAGRPAARSTGAIVLVVGLAGRGRQRRGGVGAVARRAALAQRRGRTRARARRPLRVARRGARRPARADRGLRARRRASSRCSSPLLMVRSGFSLLGQSTRVLLEAAPRGIDPDADRPRAGGASRASARCTTCTSGRSPRASRRSRRTCSSRRTRTATPAARELEQLLAERFGLEHTTLQVEHEAGDGLLDITTLNSTRCFAASSSTKRSRASPSAASSPATARGELLERRDRRASPCRACAPCSSCRRRSRRRGTSPSRAGSSSPATCAARR